MTEVQDTDPRVAVRVWMVRNNMTQAEFAELIGISASTLSQILNERREPSPATAMKFRDTCGTPMDSWYERGPDEPIIVG